MITKQVLNPVSFVNLFDDLFLKNKTFNPSESIDFRGFSTPKTNITETEMAVTFQLLVPGIEKEDLKVLVNKDVLTISFDPKEESVETQAYLLKEFQTKSFKRSYKLKETLDVENIEAKVENGLLVLNIPKKEELKQQIKEINIL